MQRTQLQKDIAEVDKEVACLKKTMVDLVYLRTEEKLNEVITQAQRIGRIAGEMKQRKSE